MRSLRCTAVLAVAIVMVGCDRDATQVTGPVKSIAVAPRPDVAASTLAVPRVAAGEWNSCGLRASGSIVCWGDLTNGQNAVPTGTFAQLESGTHTKCAVTPVGGMTCWGLYSDWAVIPPALPAGVTYKQVSVGFTMACAVRSDNTIVCFGSGSWTVSGANYASVSVGASHACAITTDGALTCWGEDREGQVSTAPTAPIGQRFTQVDAGTVHSCAVLDGWLSAMTVRICRRRRFTPVHSEATAALRAGEATTLARPMCRRSQQD
jgi:hypothetical protein